MRSALLALAASVAIVHTAIGVDHALPFIVLSRVQRWSLRRTLIITALCGVGHIASAVIIGSVAIALGLAVGQLGPLEAVRGQLGLAILVAFGLGYAALGALRLWRRQPHGHAHLHLREDGTRYSHEHLHDDARKQVVTAWTLFAVLVFGPCEALVPLLLAPGVMQDYGLLAALIGVFGALTIATMLVLVTLGVLGARLVAFEKLVGPKLAGAGDVMAGLAIAATGVAVAALGL